MNRGNRALYGQVRDSHAAMLAGNCRECVLETLGSSGSIGRDLFGMDGVEGMLRRSEIKAVIGLLVVEQWRRSAAEIVSAARE